MTDLDNKNKKYRNDPAFRQTVIDRVKRNFNKNKTNLVFMKLVSTRSKIYNVRESIKLYRIKIGRLQCKLKRNIRIKEELEIIYAEQRKTNRKNKPS